MFKIEKRKQRNNYRKNKAKNYLLLNFRVSTISILSDESHPRDSCPPLLVLCILPNLSCS